MSEGWIKTHRKMLETPALQQPLPFFLFSYFLIKAAHKPTKVNWRGQTISLARGQLILSVRAWCLEFNQSRQSVRTIIARFEQEGMLKNQPNCNPTFNPQRKKSGSLITLCNYDFYQQSEISEIPLSNPAAIQYLTQLQPTEQEGKNQEDKKLREGGANAPAPNGASPPQHFQKGDSKTTNHLLPDARNWTPKSWAELKARELLCDNDARYRRVLDEFREYEGGRGRLMKDWSFVFLGFVRKDAKWAADRADEQERFAQARARMALDNTGNDR